MQDEQIQFPMSSSPRNQPVQPIMQNFPNISGNMCDSSVTSINPGTLSNFKSTIVAGSRGEPLWSTLPAPIVQKNVPMSQEMKYMDRFILTSQSEFFLNEEREVGSSGREPMTFNDSEITSIEIHGSDCTEIENIFMDNDMQIQLQEEIIDRRTPRSLTSRSSKNTSKIMRENQPQPSPTPSAVPSPNLLGFIKNLKYLHLPDEITELKRAHTQTTSEIPNPFVMTPRETLSRANRPKLTPVTPFRLNRKKTISIFQLETQDPSPDNENLDGFKFHEEIQEEVGSSDVWQQDLNSGMPQFIEEEDSPPPYSCAKTIDASENFFKFNVSSL